jgi:filamentous hemagglutinin family protein
MQELFVIQNVRLHCCLLFKLAERLASKVLLFVAIAHTISTSAAAQVVPDNTLGGEQSSITQETIRGIDSDRIGGGARRGDNLFHSFEQFDVLEGRGAYFDNPATVQNIFSRVTGGDRSEILGRLGVLGDANLFFINPNGIVFGENASLDVGGSFVGTTANAIEFGVQGAFSASNPDVPSLLTINPSAFLFNQIPTGDIVSRAIAPSPLGGAGLQVPNGESLTLLGGNITIEGGLLNAFGGRVNVAAIADTGAVGINPDRSLAVPANINRANVDFNNAARVDVTSNNGGDIAVIGRNVNLTNLSQFFAGIGFGLGALDSQSGNVSINAEAVQIDRSSIFNAVFEGGIGNSGDIQIATGSLSLTNGSQLDTSVFGQGNAGDVVINAREAVSLDGSRLIPAGELSSVIFAEVLDNAIGNSGNIIIDTGSLSVTNGAAIIARTRGQGNAGNIIIRARDQVLFDGINGAGTSSASSTVENGAEGNGGTVEITANSLQVTNGAQLRTNSNGQGDAGSIVINASGHVSFAGASANGRRDSGAFSSLGEDVNGQGGNIEINAGSLSILDGAILSANSFGQGNAGSILINADQVSFIGRNVNGRASRATTGLGESARGQGGNIEITTGSLFVVNGSSLNARTFGQGNAGSILINARDRVVFAGSTEDGSFGSDVSSSIEEDAIGRGGNIEIITGSLFVADGARITATSDGLGDAGSVIINARNRVTFTGTAPDGNPSTLVGSGIEEDGAGIGGNVEITAGSLAVRNGAQLAALLEGEGTAGNIIIDVRDRVLFEGFTADRRFTTAAFSSVESGAIGAGGNVEIRAGSLIVRDGGQLISATESQGDAGNIIIQARDRVIFDGASPDGRFTTGAFSSVQSGGIGAGGNVEIETGSLSVMNGAQLIAATRGEGDAGNIVIRARDRVVFDGINAVNELSSGAFSSVLQGARGRSGNIDITTNSLLLQNGGQLGADTNGQGRAGNITVQADESIILEGVNQNGRTSSISTLTAGEGRGGTVRLFAPLLQIRDGASIDARTTSAYRGGNININAAVVEAVEGGQVVTATQENGEAGNIRLNAGQIRIAGRLPIPLRQLDTISRASIQGNGESGLFASTRPDSTGSGGTITLRANTLSLSDRAQISASSLGTGRAGDIAIATDDALTLTDSNITTAAAQASGGRISVEARTIQLNGDSDIRTNVESSRNNGGDITLRANSILAFGDSDILAFSQDGGGGNIDLDTSAFFGENYQPQAVNANPANLDENDRVDINATGEITSGTITAPDTSFIQNSLSELPATAIDTTTLLSNSCIVRDRNQGSFTITGAGGLPERPGGVAVSSYATGTIQSLPNEVNSSISQEGDPWQVGDRIIEPQGVYRLSNGQLVMSRDCS